MKKALFLSAIAFLAVNIAIAQPGAEKNNSNNNANKDNTSKVVNTQVTPDPATQALKDLEDQKLKEEQEINNNIVDPKKEEAEINTIDPNKKDDLGKTRTASGNNSGKVSVNPNDTKPNGNSVKKDDVKPGTGVNKKTLNKDMNPVESVYKPDPTTNDAKKVKAESQTADERTTSQGKNDVKKLRDGRNTGKAQTVNDNHKKLSTEKKFVKPSKNDAKNKAVKTQTIDSKKDKDAKKKLNSAKASTIKD